MSKRQADKELNHDNWQDDEEEPEDRGQFKQADKDEIKRRVIKTAKRSLSNSPASSPFANFGFGTASSTKLPGTTPPPPPPLPNGSALTALQGTKSQQSDSAYLGKIKSLNECLLSWVKKHVDSSPYCDLRPVFRDYERHITEIKATAPSSKPAVTSMPTTAPTFNFTPSVPSTNFNFTPASTAPKATETPTSSFASASSAFKPDAFKFSVAEPRNSAFTPQRSEGSPFGGAQSAQGSTFGSASLSSAPKPAFSFGLSAVAPAPTSKKDSNGSDDENYVPPKETIEPVKEEGAVYEIRCKLFQKKDDNYVDKGIGMLYIKPHQDKYQLLVRADTRLGNILLNIMLASTLPVSRLGKNNVALVCIPNPAPNGAKDEGVGPTTMLLRCKTGEDADKLKDALERYKSPKDSSSSSS
ncbi:nuclear pore complex protein Nup50 [Haemaphysalis longicornis]